MSVKIQNTIIIIWLVGSLIGGAFHVRNNMYGEDYPCKCEKVGYMGAGFATLVSPIWYPVVLIGKIVAIGL